MNYSQELCRLDQAGRQTLEFRIFSVAYAIVVSMVLLSGIVAWLYFQQDLIFLRKRGILKVLLLVVALVAGLFTGPIDRAVDERDSPFHSCLVLNISFLLIVPFTVMAGLAQVVLMRNRYAFYKALAGDPYLGTEVNSVQTFSNVMNSSLQRKQLFASERFVAICLAFFCLLFLAIVVSVSTALCPEVGGSNTCVIASLADIRITGVLIPFLLLAASISLYIKRELRTFPDPFNILGEIKSIFFWGLLLAFPGLALSALNFGDPNGREEVPFSYGVLIDLVFLFIFLYSVHYQIYLALHFEYQTPIGGISLEQVMKDPVGRNLLKAHLIFEFALENLYFLEAVQMMETSKGSLEQRAGMIMDVYFKEELLNISYETSELVKDRYRNGELSLDMFEEAYAEVWKLTSSDSFARFKKSDAFKTYIGVNGRQHSLCKGLEDII